MTSSPTETSTLWQVNLNNPLGADQASITKLLQRLIELVGQLQSEFDNFALRTLLITQDCIDGAGHGTLPTAVVYFDGVRRKEGIGWPCLVVRLDDSEVVEGQDFVIMADCLGRAAQVVQGLKVDGIAAASAVVMTGAESLVNGLVIRTEIYNQL